MDSSVAQPASAVVVPVDVKENVSAFFAAHRVLCECKEKSGRAKETIAQSTPIITSYLKRLGRPSFTMGKLKCVIKKTKKKTIVSRKGLLELFKHESVSNHKVGTEFYNTVVDKMVGMEKTVENTSLKPVSTVEKEVAFKI